jgi:hypothetical protein
MTDSPIHPLRDRLAAQPADLLGNFIDYVTSKQLELYPAQEEAVLELFEGKNVILNTPTGSGKSLVAAALHFQSMGLGKRSVYTSPIKALVNEKFLALCRDFGPENVGLATGDGSVNLGAPILCCTAEILANYALRYGTEAPFHDVVMDEFHYYADRERGVAWQVPLLTMKKTRFLLMSATMGATTFFAEELTKLTGVETRIVAGRERPVPLEFSYEEENVEGLLQTLREQNRLPAYVVYFTQNDASQAAQDLMSWHFCSPQDKAALKEALEGTKFTSPYGKELKRHLLHGVGVHHAGLLPKYRILVEGLAQKGLLKVICGTDTLGVGVNVPIRSVVLTRLTKFGGEKVKTLAARDFHQITGRAGRRGFDDIGYVYSLAPDHIVENAKLEAKATKGGNKKKVVKRKPPEGFVGWSQETFEKLQKAAPEPLSSQFAVSHGMLLQVLSRPTDGCTAMQELVRVSHESAASKRKHRDRAWQLFRALVDRKIVEIIPQAERATPENKLRVNVELQDDFSLNQSLSLWLIDTLERLDPNGANYAADVLSLCEAILENPAVVLRRQLDKVKNEAMRDMKYDGVPYEERLQRLEELEHPKPLREFIYQSFNEFAETHPWVGQDNIRPKSIVREMFENFRSFEAYTKDYRLERAEGVLLRHINSVHKVVTQTVPAPFKNEALQEMEDWLTGMLRGVDSSLLEEWERLRDPEAYERRKNEPVAETQADITRNKREFTAMIRTEIFRFLKGIASGDYELSLPAISSEGGWTFEKLDAAMLPYYDEHQYILLDPEARNGRHTYTELNQDGKSWLVTQMLVDPDAINDWAVRFRVDLATAREEGRPELVLLGLGPVGG